MKKFFCVSVCTLLLASTVAFADPVTKVVFEIQESGVHADFTSNGTIADCGTLDWTSGTIAKVYTTTGTIIYYPTVDAAFINGNDTSSGGLASAVFGDMSFTVWLYNNPLRHPEQLLGSITGTLYNNSFDYVEHEISLSGGSVLDGAAVIKLTSFNVNGYSWIEAMGDPTGLRSETSLTTNIINYQSDWHSTNTVITVLADESGIPEPATIGLLTLGGLLLRRKK